MAPKLGSLALGCCHGHTWYPFQKAVTWEKFKQNLSGFVSDQSGKRLCMVLEEVRKMSSAFGAPTTNDTSFPRAVSWDQPHHQLGGARSLALQVYILEDMSPILLLCYEVFSKKPEACPSANDRFILEELATCPWAFSHISFIQQTPLRAPTT